MAYFLYATLVIFFLFAFLFAFKVILSYKSRKSVPTFPIPSIPNNLSNPLSQ